MNKYPQKVYFFRLRSFKKSIDLSGKRTGWQHWWAAVPFWKICVVRLWFVLPSRLASRRAMAVASFICQRLPLLDELLISGCRATNLFSSTAARVSLTSSRMRQLIWLGTWLGMVGSGGRCCLVFIKNNLNKFLAKSHTYTHPDEIPAVKYVEIKYEIRNLLNIYQAAKHLNT